MSDNRKYYYLKLKIITLARDAIVLFCWKVCRTASSIKHSLETVPGNRAENSGKLQLDENIPYTAPDGATITRQQNSAP